MSKDTLHIAHLRKSLTRHTKRVRRKLEKQHPHIFSFFEKHGIQFGTLRTVEKLIASGVLAGNLLLVTPALVDLPKDEHAKLSELPLSEREKQFAQEISSHLLTDSSFLTTPQEILVSKLIHDYWGINATPILEGNRLNHSYGYMGYEQHLRRYPGDSIGGHDEFQGAGIAPGKGAWGYFANSKSEMSEEMIMKEKYYVAVQTLYIPDWHRNWGALKDWYKHRKVIVVNPANGKTVIADIADAGPARWTGKQFGGSPEVMEHLGLVTGKKKGKVILFFVNDGEDKIALGPVGYNERINLLAKK